MKALFASVLETARKKGPLGFEYEQPWTLWRALLPEYQGRVSAITRRADTLSLGEYTLADFNGFYAAFLAICAAHEFLCFAWGNNHGNFPLDSSVMVRSTQGWTAILSDLSGIGSSKCQSIIKDLSFDFGRSLDLHVNPFVCLGNVSLAVAPQFPLHSRPDENILRVCSILRPKLFDTTSLGKEPEMLADLRNRCPHFRLEGPVPLPKPLPDIDLIVTEESSSTLVIAELKWVRKTLRPVEKIERDKEVFKGVSQLGQIREFLRSNPGHLCTQRRIPRLFNDYEHVFFLLVARDHWLWMEPRDCIAILEFEAVATAFSRTESLISAVRDLLSYDWLPVEGRDFTIRYERATVNAVSIESEVFYTA